MSAPHFDTWSHTNLAKFAKEAYEKLQRQDEELQKLRINIHSCSYYCDRCNCVKKQRDELREEVIRLHEQNTELDAKLAQLKGKNHVG